jgi:Bacterial capsule synthesis protein PGA_cap
MSERPWAVLVPAALAAGLLAGCFGGTVRSPPEASGQRPGHHRQHHPTQRPGHGREQEGKDGGKVVTIAAVGDTAMGITPTLPPEPASYFDPIKGGLKGDVVFGNLEGTLTDVSESPKCGEGSSECFAFRAPPEYAEYLAEAGFTMMSTPTAGGDQIVKAGGRRVVFLGFAPYSNTAALTDLGAAREMIRQARQQADIVVVAFHAGAEGSDAQHVTRRRGDVPRRGPRQRRGIRPHCDRGRCRPAPRLRTACPSWHGDLPRPARRLQPRQLLRLPQLHPRRGARRDGGR